MPDHLRRPPRQRERLEVPAEAVARLFARGQPLRRLEHLDRGGLQQSATVHRHAEAHQVGRRRHEHAGSRVAGVVDVAHQVQTVVRIGRVSREVGRRTSGVPLRCVVGSRVVHAQWREHLLPHEPEERLARGGFDGGAHQDPAVARVAIPGARLEQQRGLRKGLQSFDRPLTARRQQRPLVAAIVPESGHVPHHLPHGDGPRLLRELRHVHLNLVVELQLPLLEQQADRGRGEQRGGGADPEPRGRRDGQALVEIRPAEAFGPDDGVADTDGHRDPWQILRGQVRARGLSTAFHGSGPFLRWLRKSRRRHAARVRVEGRCRHGHVGVESRDGREQAADRHDDEREPGFRPVPGLGHGSSIAQERREVFTDG